MDGTGRLLITGGLILVAVGLVISYGGRFLPLGRLPGDIVYRRGNFTLYFPVATLVVLNLLLFVVMWFFRRR